MNSLGKKILSHVIQSIGIFLIGCVSSLFLCNDCISNYNIRWPIVLYVGFIWVILWKGNEWVSHFPDRYISWLERPFARLIVGLSSHIVFTLIAITSIQICFDYVMTDTVVAINLEEIIEYSIPSVVITLIILTVMTAIKFFYSWRNLAVRHEKLKTEALASRFAVLKNQVNPHFLFNSLNVLTGLVYKDADLSAKFINKLAEVYRYVLDVQDKELVPLTEELDFVKSFVFLQKIRFGKFLKVALDISNIKDIFIAPLTLQMLIENAIKHNIISEEFPLDITIRIQKDFIVVKNPLQLKSTISDKQGIGLNNIINRYKYLTDTPVEIIQEENTFIVKIPLVRL